MNRMLSHLLLPLLLASSLLSGCATAVVGGAAAGVAALHDRRSAGAMIDDQQIELKAKQVMSEHPDIDNATQISVISFNRRALLIGQTSDPEFSRQYATLIAELPNVKSVYNEVEEGAKGSFGDSAEDAYLTSKVKLSLVNTGIEDFDPTRVNVSTSLGRVYLMGLVTHEEASAVVKKVRGISGVKKVIDIFEYTDNS